MLGCRVSSPDRRVFEEQPPAHTPPTAAFFTLDLTCVMFSPRAIICDLVVSLAPR